MSDFNWDGTEVVLRAYGSLAVHDNPYGDVVVRQERDAFEEDDHRIVIPIQDAELIADAIIAKAREIKGAPQGDAPPESKSAQTRLALPAPATNTRQPGDNTRRAKGVA